MSEIENLKIDGGSTYTVGNEDIVANEWEASKTYVKDKSYVIREHRLYVCNVTHTSVEPFDPDNWTEITVGDAIAANTTAIGSLSTLTTTEKSSIVGAVNEVDGAKQDTAILHIKKDFNNTYTIQTCISAIITEYGKKTMAFGFVLTGSGWYEGMLSFYDNNQGGGYLIMNGGTPRLWAVAYQNGTVYISEK